MDINAGQEGKCAVPRRRPWQVRLCRRRGLDPRVALSHVDLWNLVQYTHPLRGKEAALRRRRNNVQLSRDPTD